MTGGVGAIVIAGAGVQEGKAGLTVTGAVHALPSSATAASEKPTGPSASRCGTSHEHRPDREWRWRGHAAAGAADAQ
eukprot:3302788-Prymnesium_polylepis.1